MVVTELRQLFRHSNFKLVSFSASYVKVQHRENKYYTPFMVRLKHQRKRDKPLEIIHFYLCTNQIDSKDLKEVRTLMALAGIPEVPND